MVNAELPKTYVAAKIEKITPQCKCFQRFNTPLRITTPMTWTISYMPPREDPIHPANTPVTMNPARTSRGNASDRRNRGMTRPFTLDYEEYF